MIFDILYLKLTVGYSSVGPGWSDGRGGGKGRSGMSLLQLGKICCFIQIDFKCYHICQEKIFCFQTWFSSFLICGVDLWLLLTDLHRRSRLLLQSGSHHGYCLYWRCNRHLRGPRRSPRNQAASTWISRTTKSWFVISDQRRAQTLHFSLQCLTQVRRPYLSHSHGRWACPLCSSPPPSLEENIFADSVPTEYCSTFHFPSVCSCVRHRRDISHFSRI